MNSGPIVLGLNSIATDNTPYSSALIGTIGNNILVGYTNNTLSTSDSVYMVYTVNDESSPEYINDFNLFLEFLDIRSTEFIEEDGEQNLYSINNIISMDQSDTKQFVDGHRNNDVISGDYDTENQLNESSLDIIEAN